MRCVRTPGGRKRRSGCRGLRRGEWIWRSHARSTSLAVSAVRLVVDDSWSAVEIRDRTYCSLASRAKRARARFFFALVSRSEGGWKASAEADGL